MTLPHLATAALALSCTLNDTRQIQQLNLGIVVVDDLFEYVCICMWLCVSVCLCVDLHCVNPSKFSSCNLASL